MNTKKEPERNKKTRNTTYQKMLLSDIQCVLGCAITRYYMQNLPDCFFEEIANDVIETSDFENGHWNVDDIQYAIGRVILELIYKSMEEQ